MKNDIKPNKKLQVGGLFTDTSKSCQPQQSHNHKTVNTSKCDLKTASSNFNDDLATLPNRLRTMLDFDPEVLNELNKTQKIPKTMLDDSFEIVRKNKTRPNIQRDLIDDFNDMKINDDTPNRQRTMLDYDPELIKTLNEVPTIQNTMLDDSFEIVRKNNVLQNINKTAIDDDNCSSSIGETNEMPRRYRTMLDDDLDLDFEKEISKILKIRGAILDGNAHKIY